jgi:hypothetical protein
VTASHRSGTMVATQALRGPEGRRLTRMTARRPAGQ